MGMGRKTSQRSVRPPPLPRSGFTAFRQAERRAVFTHSHRPAGHSRRRSGAAGHLAAGETPIIWIPESRLSDVSHQSIEGYRSCERPWQH
ncbi:hypothetical protein OJAV_G00170670 [Oryzias javanicus]|uniref:Uncharacterized protein n=1 Tax=Oryzias javanicus TaxID=123683 RepID=A0A3S2MKI6_ORYJA|nr:hypothetical protein OJAV_G00170670 [Oryzias javanicus]